MRKPSVWEKVHPGRKWSVEGSKVKTGTSLSLVAIKLPVSGDVAPR